MSRAQFPERRAPVALCRACSPFSPSLEGGHATGILERGRHSPLRTRDALRGEATRPEVPEPADSAKPLRLAVEEAGRPGQRQRMVALLQAVLFQTGTENGRPAFLGHQRPGRLAGTEPRCEAFSRGRPGFAVSQPNQGRDPHVVGLGPFEDGFDVRSVARRRGKLERVLAEVHDQFLAVRERRGWVQAAVEGEALKRVTTADFFKPAVEAEPHRVPNPSSAGSILVASKIDAKADDIVRLPLSTPLGHDVVPLVLPPAVVRPGLGSVADTVVRLSAHPGEGHVRPSQLHAARRDDGDLVVPSPRSDRASPSSHGREARVVRSFYGEIRDRRLAANDRQRVWTAEWAQRLGWLSVAGPLIVVGLAIPSHIFRG
mmetsp:Transcript_1139/g.4816  ORF Transcript_1139/g.4816 Transcript_1139/m.4816 type:complete len:373 (+) Transcript_1139:8777-9895(+)